MNAADYLPLPPGLVAVTGDEGAGKTTLLRQLAALPDAGGLWLDLSLPGQDQLLPQEVWAQLQRGRSNWDVALQQELAEALALGPHLGKQLFMLSTGSRRKVALVGLLASGAAITCLDQPYAAVDLASIGVLRRYLNGMADHPGRSWVVADYEADTALRWQRHIALG